MSFKIVLTLKVTREDGKAQSRAAIYEAIEAEIEALQIEVEDGDSDEPGVYSLYVKEARWPLGRRA